MTATKQPKRIPWWLCCGWRSPWCALDLLAHCHIRTVCDRHDRHIMKEK